MQEWADYIKFFTGMLAIVNPFGIVPLFIAMTGHQSPTEERRSALVAALTVVLVLLLALFTGQWLLELFGITLPSFRVAGGLLLLLIAVSMLHARISPVKQTEEEAQESSQRDQVAVVPLGIPLLAGPGAISTVIVYSHRGEGALHYLLLSAVILSIALITWITLRAAPRIDRLLGTTGNNVITRIMGLLMAAIGVEIMANGLRGLFPGLS